VFTVIFAEKDTIKLFEETKMFFGPLLDTEKIAMCEWDPYADSFEAMVPDLYDIIEYKDQWRALVFCNSDIYKLNPYDFVGYAESYYDDRKRDWAYYAQRRSDRFAAYEKALENPLLKLTTGLCQKPSFKSIIPNEADFDALVSGEMPVYAYMLRCQLESVSCSELAARLDKYRREELRKFVEGDADTLISYVKNADVSGITSLIPDTEILDFIRFIGNDPLYYDPEYTECLIENTRKAQLLRPLFARFMMKDKLPSEIICLSSRTFDFEPEEQDVKWRKRDENSYSRFADFNLYNERLKYLLFDIRSAEHKQYKYDQIKLLCLLLTVAGNGIPQGITQPHRVYRLLLEFDNDIITRVCERYVSKLKATEIRIKELEMHVEFDRAKPVDDYTARQLFESDELIDVQIPPEYSPTDMFADYKGIGLSTDCPNDEDTEWALQYRTINKNFVRYLREPKRALKAAVKDGFHRNTMIEDERTLALSENQAENVLFHMQEEERRMIETSTNHIFDTKRFNEEIREADKEIKRGIGQRMTKKKTLIAGGVAIGAYLLGFLPMIFSDLNTWYSVLFSLAITGAVLAVYAIIAVIYLFVMRKKLINRFVHFNFVISGICNNITTALSQFAQYLTRAHNVMRDASVLRHRESAVSRTKRILRYHDMKIKEQIVGLSEIFSKYIDFSNVDIIEMDPYDFDFTVMREYEYEMPSISANKRITFLQQGHEVNMPVDYVQSVMLVREELYD